MERWSAEARGHGGTASSVMAPMAELGVRALVESREGATRTGTQRGHGGGVCGRGKMEALLRR